MRLRDLGQRIRARRERLGLKQHDLARALQVSPQAVSKWERGDNGPDLAILSALARLLGVSADWLLGAHSPSLDVFEATVFASAVVGAYEKSRHMAARDFATWANGCFYQLTEVVLHHDGVPIKYMGDAFLAFFSGLEHQQRAVRAAVLARQLSSERLVIGLSSGEIYLGAMGHPDYARPDVMGEVVNVAFLVRDWAEAHACSRIAATDRVTALDHETIEIVQSTAVHFKGIASPICVCELRQKL
jgi:class 3 adenylate cyclase